MSDTAELEVPPWAPEAVVQAAQFLLRRGEPCAEAFQLVQRLLSHPDMERVWRELGECIREDYRPTDIPRYQASLPQETETWQVLSADYEARAERSRRLGDAVSAERLERQAEAMARRPCPLPSESSRELVRQRAMQGLFVCAVTLFAMPRSIVTVRELEKHAAGLGDGGQTDVANEFRSLATTPGDMEYIVERRRMDDAVVAYILGLGEMMRKLYGQNHYGLIAIIANVVLKRSNIDPQLVRGILRARVNRLKSRA